MQKLILLLFVISLTAYLVAQDVPHTSVGGKDTVSSAFFKKWYHRTDLVYYLETLNDHAILETTTYGQWWRPERLAVSIEGMPFYGNRYYLDGMRVDDIFQPGSTQFLPNMQHFNLVTNTHTAQLYFSQNFDDVNYIQLAYNQGKISDGEPMAGTQEIINIFHRSPVQSADTYKHITARRHIRAAGLLEGAFTLHDKHGNAFPQRIFANFGQRKITRENHQGLVLSSPYYAADYSKIQADGYLPLPKNNIFEEMRYLLYFAAREDANSEFLYNYNEVYDLKNYTASLFGKNKNITTGFTWATNTVKHNKQNFQRNILDQDGESFEPWVADGNTHALSWSFNFMQDATKWLTLYADAYNSFIYFTPKNSVFNNKIYMQSPINEHPTYLYDYQWNSSAFAGGILENMFGVGVHFPLNNQLTMSAQLDITLDAMLLKKKSKITPNVQASCNFDWHPCYWFEMGLTLAHYRVPYNTDYLRYFSDDYMNGSIFYADSKTLFATTGGRYHHYKKSLWQTAYLEFDLPIRFFFGRHELVLQQSYKKFYHVWFTRFKMPQNVAGYYKKEGNINVFYLNDGGKQYEVGYTDDFGENFLKNTPYYFSQLTRYTYHGKKVLASLSWQSLQAAGFSALGNGANSNNLGILSETTANPNTHNVIENQDGKYAGVGRLNADKGYVLRFYLGYNICKWLQMGITAKWTDGKPFTDYHYFTNGKQVAILPNSSRGTNPTDGDFGTRHCAKWNIDCHLQGRWHAGRLPMCLNIECYNIYDFSHDLAEMAFVQDIPHASRASMIMDIPVGILTTLTIEFPSK